MATQITEREYVILPASALLEFFGMMALTPFGESANCAEKAEQIVQWIKEHDLAGLYELEPTDA